jgi:hypothetical protein
VCVLPRTWRGGKVKRKRKKMKVCRAVWFVGLDRFDIEIVGSGPAKGMDVCHRLSVLRCLVLRSFVLPLRTNYIKHRYTKNILIWQISSDVTKYFVEKKLLVQVYLSKYANAISSDRSLSASELLKLEQPQFPSTSIALELLKIQLYHLLLDSITLSFAKSVFMDFVWL